MIKSNPKFTWEVMHYNINSDRIESYDVLSYREDSIKKLKKKFNTKEEFSEALRKEMMYQYWSRSEYELIISINSNDRILLSPWCGCRDVEKVTIDVTDDIFFDWGKFFCIHIQNKVHKNEAKIDIYDQLMFRWTEFVDYCWNYPYKY